MRTAAVIVLLLLAGCSDPQADLGPEAPQALSDVILGVVVDDAVLPVAGALIELSGSDRSTQSDADGLFRFDGVAPGTYFLEVSRLNYAPAQVAATVDADDADPARVKVQLQRLFTQDPYWSQEQFNGFLTCGYDLNFMSSLCLNDYTRFVPVIGDDGGIAPQIQQTGLDDRDHDFVIDAGWKSLVVEMYWEPSAESTSPRMSAIVSHTPRPATHWYAQASGEVPVLLRIDEGVEHEDHGGSEPFLIPSEGLPNAHFFAAVDTGGTPYAVAVQQDFEVFFSTFYNAFPPADWSFLAGDGNPF